MKKVLLCVLTDNTDAQKIKEETEKYTKEVLANEFEILDTCILKIDTALATNSEIKSIAFASTNELKKIRDTIAYNFLKKGYVTYSRIKE